MRGCAEWTALAAVYDLLARIVRAAEFIEDGEREEALLLLLDLERDLREQLRQEAA